MLYQHTRNLPELMEEAVQGHAFSLLGIGVSARPRPREDSYMPAFLAGRGFARSLAALYSIPLWQISHQENHLEAAMWSAKGPDTDRFLFLHASGGTTDLLLVEKMDMFGPDATGGLPVADMAQAEENAVGTAAPTNRQAWLWDLISLRGRLWKSWQSSTQRLWRFLFPYIKQT